MSKLADNAFIDLNVALANELAIVCDGVGADVIEVIRAANSLKKGQHNVNILAPGMGVGGTCLTKDPWFLHHMGLQQGHDFRTFAAGRTANEFMPAYTISIIDRAVGGVSGKTIAVLGISFKADTGDIRFTPVKPLLDELEKRGATLRVSDSLVDPEEFRTLTKRCAMSVTQAVEDADAVAIMAPHREFRDLHLPTIRSAMRGDAFVDGRNGFDPASVRNAGFRYFGIGRGERA
jgi:UDP-N-acetyl-D-mannosaminuronic acid dehydrogenase